MSPPKDGDRPANATPDRPGEPSVNGEGVLSKLPRTRPQRSSPRRAAARAASAAAVAPATDSGRVASPAEAASTAPARSNGRPSSRAKNGTVRTPKKPATVRSAKKPAGVRGAGTRTGRPATPTVSVEPAPRQGFESETERANGTVQPPGGADLVASAAEIFGELAKAGAAKGERLLKDLLSHLPLS
jgi:hypothetical protein